MTGQPAVEVSSDRVIRAYLLITAAYTLSASLIWGVNTLFLLAAGLDILGVFIANSVFTGAMALLRSRPAWWPTRAADGCRCC